MHVIQKQLNQTLNNILGRYPDHQTSSKSDAALELASHGYMVFPLHSVNARGCSCNDGAWCLESGRHPQVPNSPPWKNFYNASSTPSLVKSDWTKFPDANIGIATGPIPGVVAFEVRGSAGLESLNRLSKDYPEFDKGLVFQGESAILVEDELRFIMFRHPNPRNHLVLKGTLLEYQGIRVVGSNGFILAPSSTLPDGVEVKFGSTDLHRNLLPQLSASQLLLLARNRLLMYAARGKRGGFKSWKHSLLDNPSGEHPRVNWDDGNPNSKRLSVFEQNRLLFDMFPASRGYKFKYQVSTNKKQFGVERHAPLIAIWKRFQRERKPTGICPIFETSKGNFTRMCWLDIDEHVGGAEVEHDCLAGLAFHELQKLGFNPFFIRSSTWGNYHIILTFNRPQRVKLVDRTLKSFREYMFKKYLEQSVDMETPIHEVEEVKLAMETGPGQARKITPFFTKSEDGSIGELEFWGVPSDDISPLIKHLDAQGYWHVERQALRASMELTGIPELAFQFAPNVSGTRNTLLRQLVKHCKDRSMSDDDVRSIAEKMFEIGESRDTVSGTLAEHMNSCNGYLKSYIPSTGNSSRSNMFQKFLKERLDVHGLPLTQLIREYSIYCTDKGLTEFILLGTDIGSHYGVSSRTANNWLTKLVAKGGLHLVHQSIGRGDANLYQLPNNTEQLSSMLTGQPGRDNFVIKKREPIPDTFAPSQKLAVLEIADELGNVREACKQVGIGTSTFYEWRKRYESQGIEGLTDKRKGTSPM